MKVAVVKGDPVDEAAVLEDNLGAFVALCDLGGGIRDGADDDLQLLVPGPPPEVGSVVISLSVDLVTDDAAGGRGPAPGGVSLQFEELFDSWGAVGGCGHGSRTDHDRFRIVDPPFLEALVEIIPGPLPGRIPQEPGGGLSLDWGPLGGEPEHRAGGPGVVDEGDGLDGEFPLIEGEREVEGPGLEIVEGGGPPQAPGQPRKALGPLPGSPWLEALPDRTPDHTFLVGGPESDGFHRILVGGIAAPGEFHEDVSRFGSGEVAQGKGDLAAHLWGRIGRHAAGVGHHVVASPAQGAVGENALGGALILQHREAGFQPLFSEVGEEPNGPGGDPLVLVLEQLRHRREGPGSGVPEGAEAEMADIHRRAAQGGDLSGGGGEVDPWDDRGEGGGSDPVNGA